MSQPSDCANALLDPDALRLLTTVLEDAKQLGFLGPGPVSDHIERALPILSLLPADGGRVLDLGSGGGVPGLVLALAQPIREWALLEGSNTRSSFLARALNVLGLNQRVEVVAMRAEEAARSSLRGSFGAVTSRGFGAPPVTAECAAPFLDVGGHLVVAEPPGGSPSRWPSAGIGKLGLRLGVRIVTPSAFQVLDQVVQCPDRYPRRTGIPAKRPLF